MSINGDNLAEDSQRVFADEEFDHWAHKEELSPSEKVLVPRFLNPALSTLRAGTAGGRIPLALQELGFNNLCGYDIVPGRMAEAKRRDKSGQIRFEVGDATELHYQSESFEQIIYLQQILSMIGDEGSKKAAAEAFRILKPGGVALFSFACKTLSTVLCEAG